MAKLFFSEVRVSAMSSLCFRGRSTPAALPLLAGTIAGRDGDGIEGRRDCPLLLLLSSPPLLLDLSFAEGGFEGGRCDATAAARCCKPWLLLLLQGAASRLGGAREVAADDVDDGGPDALVDVALVDVEEADDSDGPSMRPR